MNILDRLINLASRHVGDENLKKFYAISLLSIALKNPDEPTHIHVWGAAESGKTNLQTLFLELVPAEHKDIASDFSAKCLLYAKLNPGTVISINDKILNDNIASLINLIADSTSWRNGRTVAVVLGKERVNLVFPPRSLIWLNSNRRIIDYNLREVDPDAVEGRFLVFEKKYEDDAKKNIFLKRNVYLEHNVTELEEVRGILNEMFKNPKTINCSEELRNIIWNKSKEMGINLIRSIGRNLTMCQILALTNDRTEVTKEDIDEVFKLLKSEIKTTATKIETPNIKELTNDVKGFLVSENLYRTLPAERKVCYSLKELQKRLGVADIIPILDHLKETKIIGEEVVLVGIARTTYTCYYLI